MSGMKIMRGPLDSHRFLFGRPGSVFAHRGPKWLMYRTKVVERGSEMVRRQFAMEASRSLWKRRVFV